MCLASVVERSNKQPGFQDGRVDGRKVTLIIT